MQIHHELLRHPFLSHTKFVRKLIDVCVYCALEHHIIERHRLVTYNPHMSVMCKKQHPLNLLLSLVLTVLTHISGHGLVKCKCHIFADDTTIYTSGPSPAEAQQSLITDLSKVHKWYCQNKLTMNIEKSGVMAIGSERKIGNEQLHVTVNDRPLRQEKVVKLLGVQVDANLKWDAHIKEIVNKLSPKIGLLSRLRYMLPSNLLEVIYKSIIQPHLDYCDKVWGNRWDGNVIRSRDPFIQRPYFTSA